MTQTPAKGTTIKSIAISKLQGRPPWSPNGRLLAITLCWVPLAARLQSGCGANKITLYPIFQCLIIITSNGIL